MTSIGIDGHVSTIIANASGTWELKCIRCDYTKSYPVPLGNVVQQEGNLINDHPLGQIVLFEAKSLTFFTSKVSYTDHCKSKGIPVCWRCRRRSSERFCGRCRKYCGGKPIITIENLKDCFWCGNPKKDGVCAVCDNLVFDNDAIGKCF